ncbi:MAG: MBL fold metallo-hydrolase [Chitinophagaceae bacterium]
MSLFVASLNSGSNGNCYYIGNKDEAVLVDAGISCREIEKRMNSLGLDPAKLKALFVTHEHTDHISGIPTLVKKFRLPVYITPRTYNATGFSLDDHLVNHFNAFEPVQIGALSITAFPKWHDAIDPHSFVISCEGVTTGVFTDIGEPCKHVIEYFKRCHAIFLESNYDEAMLANSRYPVFLQNRISGKHGHLSNAQAVQLFAVHKPAIMTHVFLCHLSKENNHPEMAEALFNSRAGGTKIIHASRYSATAVYQIIATAITAPLLLPTLPGLLQQQSHLQARKKRQAQPKLQLSLF